MRSGTVFVLASLAALALTAAGAGVVSGEGEVRSTTDVSNVTTGDVLIVNRTGAMLTGEVLLEDEDTVGTARMEYRERSSDGEWRRTRPRKFSTEERSHPRRWFGWNVTGLQPATTYEYRLRVTTRVDNSTGAVRTFATNESTDRRSPTRTQTPPPCPSFRGAASLCTTTPTPTPTPTPAIRSSLPDTDRPAGDSDDWLAGLLPLLAWAGAVVVVAPVVLGGLLWLDSFRDMGSR